MSIQHPGLLGLGMPYHIQSQLSKGDSEVIINMLSEADSNYDTCEIGTAYGGSAFFGARRAKMVQRRHWCIDQFGRPGALLVDEPSMAVVFVNLAVEGLERYTVLFPGTSVEASPLLSPHIFGALFVDGDHVPEWARCDSAFAIRHLVSGGFVAWHDHARADGRYAEYSAEVTRIADRNGWLEVDHRDSTTLYRVPWSS